MKKRKVEKKIETLKEQLHRESKLTRKESMKILHEFEKFEDKIFPY